MATIVDERALDERLARLEAARSWSPRIVSRLEGLLRDADDAALFRVNPFTFARQRELDLAETVDLFLHATDVGLFDMDWLLICPRCACAVERRPSASSSRSMASTCQHAVWRRCCGCCVSSAAFSCGSHRRRRGIASPRGT